MSASDWKTCPRCKHRAKVERSRLNTIAQDQYGKVTASEYAALCAAGDEIPEPSTHLREDWEVGTRADGEFSVYYGCHCETCGFSHEFKHKEMLKIGIDET